jgi:hypothetical protein
LLYAVLIDLTDEVAEALQRPFAAISIDLSTIPGKGHQRGDADDLILYLAANTRLLGIVKRKPPPNKLDLLLSLTASSEP